ncbi:hypothetical protein CP97_14717 [Aurantiacibacter atlanticus]|uniref:Uncharacterized protein n=1 Tax=Aurantiacibacter atlanticus TaxID=1648404 RepID=A0A168M1D2_9SPHN|nr:hypothetical protein CP97_14717 [Aurantiacibacter atlanticus]
MAGLGKGFDHLIVQAGCISGSLLLCQRSDNQEFVALLSGGFFST